jgi:hypothetical protein
MKAREAEAAETTEQMLKDYVGPEAYPDDDEFLEEAWEAEDWEPPFYDPDPIDMDDLPLYNDDLERRNRSDA